jgi:CubicO group peptidase (beta-lactamase class C family)
MEDLRAVISAELLSRPVPGLALGLISDGQVIAVSGMGECSAGGDLVSADTVFEAASLTKPVVARLAIDLHRARLLDIDAPLSVARRRADAGLDPRFERLTPRHILSHRSGLPNWRPKGEPLGFLFEPGSREHYSGEAFNLLLEAIGQMLQAESPVGSELDRRIREYGLHHGHFIWWPELGQSCAMPHDRHGNQMPKSQPSMATGAGSLHCSVRDYAQFVANWIDASRQEADEAFSWRSVDGHRALGWAVAANAYGEVLWQHGDNPGYKHLATFSPASGDGVVVMTNGERGRGLAIRAATRILGSWRIWEPLEDS